MLLTTLYSTAVKGVTKKIPSIIVKDLREAGKTDEEIYYMSPRERFIAYCEWNGIIGYGDRLWELAQRTVD